MADKGCHGGFQCSSDVLTASIFWHSRRAIAQAAQVRKSLELKKRRHITTFVTNQPTMASPAVAVKAPLAPSPAHTHENNTGQCDNSPKKNCNDRLHDSPLSGNLPASLLSARIVANALRPFYGKARDTSNETSSSSRQSGLDILNNLNIHDNEIAHQLLSLAEQQHNDVGDGTKTVVILAGSILDAATRLLESSETDENSTHISPSQIASCFRDAADYAVKVLSAHSEQADITNPENLSTLCQHHLTSSAIGNDPHAKIISALTVDAILELDRQSGEEDCLPDLDRLHCVQEISGDVGDSEVFSGLILKRPESGVGGGKSNSDNPRVASSAVSVVTSTTEAAPKSLEGDVKVAILEYWLSPSAELPDDGDEEAREEILREDRRRLLNDCKQIKKSGAKVVLIAAKEAVGQDEGDEKSQGEGSDDDIVDVNLQICMHFLAKMGIMVISGLDEHQLKLAINSLGGILIPFPENISLQELGSAKKANEVKAPSGSSWIHFEGTRTPAATIMLHGPNNASLEESKQTIEAILSFVGNLFRDPHVVPGGGAAEIEASLRLRIQSTASADHIESQCMRAFADALEVIPYTLAENSDINPAAVVTALRRQHAEGQTAAGLDVGDVGGIHVDMVDAGIVNTLTSQVSAIQLATTFACCVLEKSEEV